MPTYTLPQYSGVNFTQGADKLLIYVAQQVPFFVPLLLTSFFFIIALSGFMIQKKTEGKGDGIMWIAIGMFMTMILSFILFLIEGLITLEIMIAVLSLTIIAGIVFFLDKKS